MSAFRVVLIKWDWQGREWRTQVSCDTREQADHLREWEGRDLSQQGWSWDVAEQAWVKGSEQVRFSIEADERGVAG